MQKRISNVQPDLKILRARAHALKPVVRIGNDSLHAGIHNEIEVALTAHELIKVAIDVDDRELRKKIARQICNEANATLVLSIGKRIVIYRERPAPTEQSS